MSKYIYLPIEIKAREMDAMILQACVLAERGTKVFLGEKTLFRTDGHRMPKGIYLGKTITHTARKHYQYLQGLGFTITALDEEGLVIYSPEIYKTRRIDPEAIHIPVKLFAWGEANASIWQEFLTEDERNRIHITGNPRFDLLRKPLRKIYQEKANELRQRYGNYILFNSNFHWVNTRIATTTRLPDPEDVAAGKFPIPKFYNPDLARYRIALFRAYLEAIPRLAATFPDVHFIIRPHPAEHHSPWKDATRHLNNCSVILEGEVAPWILGSSAVLHHSCTTAVEAFVLDKPVICYRPLIDDELDPELPVRLSHQARHLTELEALVAGVLNRTLDARETEQHRAFLQNHLAAITGPLASDRIADILVDQPLEIPALATQFKTQLRSMKKRLKRRLKEKFTGKNQSRTFIDLFPPTPVAEIHEKIRCYRELLDRFHTVSVTELDTNLYRIEADAEE